MQFSSLHFESWFYIWYRAHSIYQLYFEISCILIPLHWNPWYFLWSLMDIICILSIVIMIRIMKLLLLHVCGRLANKKYRAEKASILNGYVSSIIILSVLYYFSNVYFWMSIIPIRMHNWRKMSRRQIQSWTSPSYKIYILIIITYNFLDESMLMKHKTIICKFINTWIKCSKWIVRFY